MGHAVKIVSTDFLWSPLSSMYAHFSHSRFGDIILAGSSSLMVFDPSYTHQPSYGTYVSAIEFIALARIEWRSLQIS